MAEIAASEIASKAALHGFASRGTDTACRDGARRG